MRLLLRCVSVVIVLACLVPRGVGGHQRLLVVAVEGVDPAVLDSLSRQGLLPTLTEAMDNGIDADIQGWASGGRTGRWRRIFTGDAPVAGGDGAEAVASATPRYLWDDVVAEGDNAVVVNVPTDSRDAGRLPLGWHGADLDGDFIGASHGMVLDAAVILGRRVGWPYSMSASHVAAVADALGVGQWSDWLEAETEKDSAKGLFKIYRIDADMFYLTPVYAPAAGAVPGEVRADSFSSAATGSPGYLYDHAYELTEPKEARALQLAGGDWKLFVYFEALISSVSYANRSFLDARDIAAGGRRADAGDMITRAYTAVDTRVHDLVAQAGDGLCLALVFEFADYPSTSAASRKEPLPALGRLVVSCGAGRHVAAMTRPDDVAATLRYLAGLSGPNGQGTPLLEVRTRCWTPTRPPLAPAGDGGTLMPATADTLRGLGSVEYASSPS